MTDVTRTVPLLKYIWWRCVMSNGQAWHKVETVRALDRQPPSFDTQFSPHEGSAQLLRQAVLPQTSSGQDALPDCSVDFWLPHCSPSCSVPLLSTINCCTPSAESHYEWEQPAEIPDLTTGSSSVPLWTASTISSHWDFAGYNYRQTDMTKLTGAFRNFAKSA